MAIKFWSTANVNDRKKMISAPIIHYCIHIKIVTIIENNQQLPLPNFAKFQRFSTRSANVSKIWEVLFLSHFSKKHFKNVSTPRDLLPKFHACKINAA